MNISAYCRLMRFHKPAGIALLWLPTAWALWVANHGFPPFHLLIYFILGTIFMRAAGCVVNDIADRHIDLHVNRTKARPLTSGEITLIEALTLLFMLLFASLLILLQLPFSCFYYAVFALLITLLYPFCKRFFQAPQLILGLAFSMGIPMAYVASGVAFNKTMVLLFVINFIWIVAYDTMYAMADREDDLKIGVKSTAILFGSHDRQLLFILQTVFHGLWIIIAQKQHYSVWFYVLWAFATGVLFYQQHLIRTRNPILCLRAFSTNSLYGLLMWFALILEQYIKI